MSALSLGTILSNSIPQINTPNQKIFNYRKPSDSKEASNVQVLTRTKEYMEEMFNIICPPLKHANSNRLKSSLFLLKIIIGRILNPKGNGNCITKQATFGGEMRQYGYSRDLGERQIKRLIKHIKDLGLISYKRSKGERSVYIYEPSQMAYDIYFYFIKNNKSYIKIECPDMPKQAVDKIFKGKKCHLETQKMSPQDYSGKYYKSTTCKKNVTSNNINIKYIHSPSFFNSSNKKKEIQNSHKEPDKEENIVSTLRVKYVNPEKNIKMNESQQTIFEKVCRYMGLEGMKLIIFKDEVEKNLERSLGDGKTLSDFEFRLNSLYAELAERMYWI
jgi:hypothetical protein